MSIGRKIIFVIALLVFLGSLGMIVNYYFSGWKTEQALSSLAEMTGEEDLVTDKGVVVAKYTKLYQKNPEMVGWIKIDDTRIDYPVMQSPKDPEFYLHHNFEKEPNGAGVPFIDTNSDIFKPTYNWLVYGHNMKDGSMFHTLVEYADAEFYQKHPTVKFDTIYKGGQGEYQVVAAFYSQIYPESKNVFKYYEYAGLRSKTDFDNYMLGVRSLAEYSTGVQVEYGDQLITLSTCSYHVPDRKGRFVVVAKRIR
ncbi:MAG: class B sortase [Firmicutes bacterium]|jgi:sortase B|nr:class B sortase [Bacillota bacterium]NBI62380.1 class B sortase [Clostridiales bacterium]